MRAQYSTNFLHNWSVQKSVRKRGALNFIASSTTIKSMKTLLVKLNVFCSNRKSGSYESAVNSLAQVAANG